jgi:hypothetical protein
MVSISGDWNAQSEKPITEPGETTITGGGKDAKLLQVWKLARDGRLNAFAGKMGKLVSNESQFEIPTSVLPDGWDQVDDRGLGVTATGVVKAPDGSTLPGFAELRTESGDTLGGQKATWGLWVHVDPPDGVFSGSNEGFPTLEVHVQVEGGLDYLESDAGMRTSIDTQYGELGGVVLDAAGNPVNEAEVNLNDQERAYTGSDGTFATYAPSGTDLDVSIADKTILETFNLQPGDSDSTTLQFGGVEVTVRGPGGTLVPNVPVQIDGKTYFTGKNGSVADYEKAIEDHEIQVLDEDPITVTVLGPGNVASHTYDGSRAVEVDVTDQAGNEVENLPVRERLLDVYTQTAEGSATLVKL